MRRRAAPTWALKVPTPRPGTPVSTAWFLVPEDDREPAGPFGSLDAAAEWLAQNGGGWMEYDSKAGRAILVGDRPRDQLPLLRFFHGIGWCDYVWLESRPLA